MGQKANKCVFVIDDEAPVRKAVCAMLESSGFSVEAFEDADSFLETADPTQAVCAVVDVRMPGTSGLELQTALQQRDIRLPLVFLSGHGDIPMAVSTMQKGAVSFLEKPVQLDDLISAVETAVSSSGEEELRREFAESFETLTPREREVCELLADGKPVRVIASILGISQSTVRVQRVSILKKMHADSVIDLARMLELIFNL